MGMGGASGGPEKRSGKVHYHSQQDQRKRKGKSVLERGSSFPGSLVLLLLGCAVVKNGVLLVLFLLL